MNFGFDQADVNALEAWATPQVPKLSFQYTSSSSSSSSSSTSSSSIRFMEMIIDPPAGTLAARQLWYVGVSLIMLSCFVGALGDNLIRRSHRPARIDLGEETMTNTSSYLLWIIGLFLTVVANTSLTIWALSYADASLLVPFAGLHVVLAVAFAYCINHEILNCRSWTAVLIICSGILCTVATANKETVNYTVDDLIILFKEPYFLGVTIVLSLMCLSCTYVFWYGAALGMRDNIRALCLAVVCGIFGAYGAISSKMLSEVLKFWQKDKNVAFRYEPYLILTVASLMAIMQIIVYNTGLKRFSAAILMPIILATIVVAGTFLGAIFFREYQRFTSLAYVMMPLGVLVTVIGIVLLTMFSDDDSEFEYGSDDDNMKLTSEGRDDDDDNDGTKPLLGSGDKMNRKGVGYVAKV